MAAPIDARNSFEHYLNGRMDIGYGLEDCLAALLCWWSSLTQWLTYQPNDLLRVGANRPNHELLCGTLCMDVPCYPCLWPWILFLGLEHFSSFIFRLDVLVLQWWLKCCLSLIAVPSALAYTHAAFVYFWRSLDHLYQLFFCIPAQLYQSYVHSVHNHNLNVFSFGFMLNFLCKICLSPAFTWLV